MIFLREKSYLLTFFLLIFTRQSQVSCSTRFRFAVFSSLWVPRKDAVRKPPCIPSHFQIYEWLHYSEETVWAGGKRKVFFLLQGAAVEKRSMSSGFPPRVCPAFAVYRSRTTVAGFMREHQTSPGPDIDDFTRIDTNVGAGVSSHVAEDVSPPCRHEFRLYAVYYIAGVCQQCQRTTVLFTCHQRRKYSRFVRQSQARTWHGFGSLFHHRYLRAKECLNLIGYRYFYFIWCQLSRSSQSYWHLCQYLFNIEDTAAEGIQYRY